MADRIHNGGPVFGFVCAEDEAEKGARPLRAARLSPMSKAGTCAARRESVNVQQHTRGVFTAARMICNQEPNQI